MRVRLRELTAAKLADGVDPDGRVADPISVVDNDDEVLCVETYYRPAQALDADGRGFFRILLDDGSLDIETRIPFHALIASGWTPPADWVEVKE